MPLSPPLIFLLSLELIHLPILMRYTFVRVFSLLHGTIPGIPDYNTTNNRVRISISWSMIRKIKYYVKYRVPQTTVQEFVHPSDGRDETECLQKEGSWISLSTNGSHAAVVAGNTIQFYQVFWETLKRFLDFTVF